MTASLPDPFTMPEWQALRREASLVSQLIGAGVTALGRASYGSGFGEYYTAFFGLSIGIERLAKLILVADHALTNAGALPDQKVVRGFGHDLKALTDKVDQIATRRNLKVDYAKPQDPICWAALNSLNAFASASQGRYANFEAIGNPAFDPAQEPVNKWWAEVVEPILTKHYRGTGREAKVRTNAQMVNALVGGSASVLHTDEGGRSMRDVETASERTGQTKWAQKYGRYYTLCIVRWLSNVFEELARDAANGRGMDALFGHWEFFSTYTVTDDFLLNRKTWPLT
jgi:hypothetical protein